MQVAPLSPTSTSTLSPDATLLSSPEQYDDESEIRPAAPRFVGRAAELSEVLVLCTSRLVFIICHPDTTGMAPSTHSLPPSSSL